MTKKKANVLQFELGLVMIRYFLIAFFVAAVVNFMIRFFLINFIDGNVGLSAITIDWIANFFFFSTQILVFLKLFHKKFDYINIIENGVTIIEKGNLDYYIPVEGKDELTALALRINELRRTLEKQTYTRELIMKENHDMITAISHDIKTPLTSVICYLDLIKDNKTQNPEEKEIYIKNALKKAYQIRDLTNTLFSHSIAENKDVNFHYEKVNGNEFLAQVLSETLFFMEEKGYIVTIKDTIEENFTLNVDIQQFRRVFDNLCSNVIKYAEESQEITFNVILEFKTLRIIQTNLIKEINRSNESFGIGLKTCKKIAERHKGSFKSWIKENEFVAIWIIPTH